jgi:hypothetical protein
MRFTRRFLVAAALGAWLSLAAACTDGTTPDCSDGACAVPPPPPIEGGIDGGIGAGIDGGIDAGIDAGGIDASIDAGIDAAGDAHE